MPFDASCESPALRVATLVEALRGEMPKKFKWDFSTIYEETACGSYGCALGLASLLWPNEKGKLLNGALDPVADFFGLSVEDVDAVFYGGRRMDVKHSYRYGNPQPKTVARELEKRAAKNTITG